VTGTVSPSSVNRRIMPTLRPSNPRELLRLMIFLSLLSPLRLQLAAGVLCERQLIKLSRLTCKSRAAFEFNPGQRSCQP
jgi:hypothetical protein